MKKLSFLLLIVLIGCAKDPFLTDDNGTFKDSRDKQEYKWIRIGEQIWMAENLAFLPNVSSSSSGSPTSPFYYVYGYEGSSVSAAKQEANYATYGVLYNWEAAITACPAGWRLPSDEEWTVLTDYLGSSSGRKLKWTSGWYNGNGDNSSGFTAIPGGNRYDGGFDALGWDAWFWSSTEDGSSNAWDRELYDDIEVMLRFSSSRWRGCSVRCLKN